VWRIELKLFEWLHVVCVLVLPSFVFNVLTSVSLVVNAVTPVTLLICVVAWMLGTAAGVYMMYS